MISAARTAVLGMLVAVFSVMGASAAQAYPDPVVKITVGDSRFVGGLPLTFTATSSVECEVLTVTFDGQTRTGSGTTIEGTFDTPRVERVTPEDITVTCSYLSDGVGAEASDTATVTLLPASGEVEGVDENISDGDGGSGGLVSDAGGLLPDTGGSNLWILVLGGALVVVGGGAVVASRRRS